MNEALFAAGGTRPPPSMESALMASAFGVGFELARVPTIYPQAHDIPLDYVVTERGLQRREANGLVLNGKT